MASFPFRTLLVATDFSVCADAALSLADKMAGDGGTIVLLHATELAGGLHEDTLVQPDPGRPAAAMGQMARVSAEAKMREQVERVGVRALVKLETRIGQPVEAIVAAARDRQADAIVMGTHGRTGLDHLLLGSVAERVVRASLVPVVTVRGGCPADAASDRTSAEEQMLDESSG